MTPEYSTFRKPQRANSYDTRRFESLSGSDRSATQSRSRDSLVGSNLRRNVSFSIDTQSANFAGYQETRQTDGGLGSARSLMLNSLISPRHEYSQDVYQSSFAEGLGLLSGPTFFEPEMDESYASVEPDDDAALRLNNRLKRNESFDSFGNRNGRLELSSAGLPPVTTYGSNGSSQIDTRTRSNTLPIARPAPLTHSPMSALSGPFGTFQQNPGNYRPKESQERIGGAGPPAKSVPVSRRNSNERLDIWEDFESLSLSESKGPAKDGVRMSLFNESSGHSTNADFPPFSQRLVFEDENTSPGFNRRYSQTSAGSKRFPHIAHRDSYPDLVTTSSAALDLAYVPQASRQSNADLHNPDWDQISSAQVSDHGLRQTRPVLRQAASMYIGSRKGPPLSINTVMYGNEIPQQEAYLPDSMTTLGNIDPVFGRIHANSRDLSDRPVSPPNNICRFFQQGHCSRGDRCTFIHTFKPVPPESPHPILSPVSNGASPYNYPTSPLSPTFYSQLPNNGFHSYTKAGFNNSSPSNGKSAQPNPNTGKQVSKKASTDVEASNRFSGVPIEDMVGEVYSLCKDQHGCRYLQKKLEEQNQKYVDIIFHEVYGHFVELMTDPFGNYLCQKLLEFCSDEQRTIIIDTVAPELVSISLNMHGTRAVQKMIEFLSNAQQIRMIIVALNANVVTLIKDLNGNHVVQKCLHRLKSADNQFIYNGVCDSLIEVATHRHGCCVLQRCIDYSSESQKSQLVSAITYHALTLVQDPFGNYVVQYVLDLNEPRLSDPLIRRFFGNACLLSVQKFSSNVMEKCIRVSKPDTRKGLINELLDRETLDKLLRDSFGNYVVQTALDYAEVNQRAMLVDAIRPLLPAIRNTPYGKRIQGKLLREQVHSATQQQSMGPYGYNYRGPVNMIGMNDVSYSYM